MLEAIPRPSVRLDVLAPIGRGGMAEVFLVAMQAPGGVTKLAVLKRIWPELASDPDFATMFLDEAKLAVRLGHPNVVQTYEVLSQGDELALSMEYLEGQTLTRVLGRAQAELDLAQKLRLICDVLAGLEHAHNLCGYDGTPLGVVHRDVSPQNVFVTYDGHVKVMDFGVAKSVGGGHLTRPGGLKGKLTYMAPEQRRDEAVDRRADIFSVGVMLWEMLASRRMWHGMSGENIAHALMDRQACPALPNEATLPPELAAVCRKALAPRCEDRFGSAAEMERVLARLVPAAEGHPRNLSRAMSRIMTTTFAKELAERQALIERHLRELGAVPEATSPSERSTVNAADTTERDARPSSSFPTVTPLPAGQVVRGSTSARLPFPLGRAWGFPRFRGNVRLAAAGLSVAVLLTTLFVISLARAPIPAASVSAALPRPSVVEVRPLPALEAALRHDDRGGAPAEEVSREELSSTSTRRRHRASEAKPREEDLRPFAPRSKARHTLAKPLDTADPYAPYAP